MATIRVLLIEDNRLLRDGATAILNAEPDIKAISVGGTNGDALAKARAFKPHVVLLDLGLRNMNSVRIVQSMRKEFPKTEVIVMDLIPAHAEVAEFVKRGFRASFSKTPLARTSCAPSGQSPRESRCFHLP
jgi:DNA-binding NarL/FixJ family response regulator